MSEKRTVPPTSVTTPVVVILKIGSSQFLTHPLFRNGDLRKVPHLKLYRYLSCARSSYISSSKCFFFPSHLRHMFIHCHLNLWSLHPAVHPSHLYLSASLICIHHSLPPYCPNDPSFCHKVSLLTFLQDNMCTTLLVSMIILALVFQASVNTSWSGRASHLFTPKTPQNALLLRPSPLCPLSLSSSSSSPSESSSTFSFTLFGYILTYPYFTVRTGYSPAVSSCLCSYMSLISWALYRNPEPELKTSNGGGKKKRHLLEQVQVWTPCISHICTSDPMVEVWKGHVGGGGMDSCLHPRRCGQAVILVDMSAFFSLLGKCIRCEASVCGFVVLTP